MSKSSLTYYFFKQEQPPQESIEIAPTQADQNHDLFEPRVENNGENRQDDETLLRLAANALPVALRLR